MKLVGKQKTTKTQTKWQTMAERKIYITTNYAQFRFLNRNRDVNPELLLASIKKKNLLIDDPICVDKDMNVLKGQNRLIIAEIIKSPISYFFAEEMTEDDIAQCEVKRAWVLTDYLKYYGHLPPYIFIKLVIDIYKIPLHCAVACCAFGDSPYEKFRQGTFALKKDSFVLERSIKMTMEVVEFLKNLVSLIGKKNASFNNRLFRAIFHCCTLENYNHDHMLSALQSYQKYALELLNINSQSLIVESLKNGIYNRRLSDKNKI